MRKKTIGEGRANDHTAMVAAMVDPTVWMDDWTVAVKVVMMDALMVDELVVVWVVVKVDLLALLPVTQSNVPLIVSVSSMMLMMVYCR